LADRLMAGEIGLRCFLLSNPEYKQRLAEQRRSEPVVRALRLARLPHFVWVVEAHDKDALRAGKPSVEAELIFDTTSERDDPRLCALTLPGGCVVVDPDTNATQNVAHLDEPWRSIKTLPPHR
jgi:hypothetical protein